MWVVDIIENCITLWNSTLSSIWSMLTQSPETFHNGAVTKIDWKIRTIHRCKGIKYDAGNNDYDCFHARAD